MKKLLVFGLLCVFLFTASLINKENYDILESAKNVQIFTSKKQDIEFENIKVLPNANGQIIYCSFDQYKVLKNKLKNISGVSFIFDKKHKELNDFENYFNVKLLESNTDNFVGFTSMFNSSVFIKGKKINIQGYKDKDKIIIGTPLILGSY